jgi:hypothetical protein
MVVSGVDSKRGVMVRDGRVATTHSWSAKTYLVQRLGDSVTSGNANGGMVSGSKTSEESGGRDLVEHFDGLLV